MSEKNQVTEKNQQEENKLNMKMIAIAGGVLLVALVIIIIVVMKAIGGKSDGAGSGGLFSSKGNGSYWENRIQVGDVVEFGTYEQDGNTGNGAEPIEWVVANQQGENYLLVSHYVLDCQMYDDGTGQNSDASGLQHEGLVYYENSNLRKWLNESFAEEAFGKKEREYLLPVSVKEDEVTADSNNSHASDYAFVLSFNELKDYLGDCIFAATDDNGYNLYKSAAWMCPATEYAKAQGCPYKTNQEIMQDYNATTVEAMRFTDDAYTNPEYMSVATGGVDDPDYLKKGDYGLYWMRDRFTDESVAAGHSYVVNSYGISRYDEMTNSYGVRPAIYVSIQNPEEN